MSTHTGLRRRFLDFDDAISNFLAALLQVAHASGGLIDLALVVGAVAAKPLVFVAIRLNQPEGSGFTIGTLGLKEERTLHV